MNKPVISACIISYNQEKYLEQTLELAASQKLNVSYEIIVSDDCSTDGSSELIEKFSKKHPSIKVLKHSTNLGMHKNWVTAINSCEGDFVAICEGDDFWQDEFKLQKQYDALTNDKQAFSCFTDAALESHKPLDLRHNSYLKENGVEPKACTYDLQEIATRNFIPTCTLMFRKTGTWTPPASYYKSPYADWFLHIHNTLQGHSILLPEPTSTYRLHDAGVFGQISLDHRNIVKLRCLLALKVGFLDNEILNGIFRSSIRDELYLIAEANQKSGKHFKFIRLKILSLLYKVSGSPIFANLATKQ